MLVGDDAMVDSAATEMCRRIFYTDLVSVADDRAEPRVRRGFVDFGSWTADDDTVPDAGWSNLTGSAALLLRCTVNASGVMSFAGCDFRPCEFSRHAGSRFLVLGIGTSKVRQA